MRFVFGSFSTVFGLLLSVGVCLAETGRAIPDSIRTLNVFNRAVYHSSEITKMDSGGCSHYSYAQYEKFDWVGACAGGVISGSGLIRYFDGGHIVEQIQVGDKTEFELEEGAIVWRKDAVVEFGLGRPIRPSITWFGGILVTVDPERNLQLDDSIKPLLEGAFDFFERNKGNEVYSGKKIGAIIVNFIPKGSSNRNILAAVYLLPDGSISPNQGSNHVAEDFESTAEQYNKNVRRDLAEAEKQKQKREIQAQRSKREQEWSLVWGQILESTDLIKNTADLVRFNKGSAIATLAGGRDIFVRFSDPSFRDGHIQFTDFQQWTDIYAGIPKAEFTWEGFLEASQEAKLYPGLFVHCIVSPSDAQEMAEGQQYIVKATLVDLNQDRAVFNCGDVRPSN